MANRTTQGRSVPITGRTTRNTYRTQSKTAPAATKPIKPIKIAQLNMQNAETVTGEINHTPVSKHFDIIATQEPYSYRNSIPGFGLGSKVIFDMKKFTGLAASRNVKATIIVINPTRTVTRLEHLSNTHFACAEITTASQKLFIVSAYFQCSDPIHRYLQHLEQIAYELRG